MAHPFLDGCELPIYVANFVLMDYGTGAIFGCPAHDQRDLDFALTYNLPVLPVVLPKNESADEFQINNSDIGSNPSNQEPPAILFDEENGRLLTVFTTSENGQDLSLIHISEPTRPC